METSNSRLSGHMRRPFRRRPRQPSEQAATEVLPDSSQEHRLHEKQNCHDQLASTILSAKSKLSSAISHILPATNANNTASSLRTKTRTRRREIRCCLLENIPQASVEEASSLPTTSTISHNLRYSLSSSSPKAPALFWYLSIVACVTAISLLNLTTLTQIAQASSSTSTLSSSWSQVGSSQQQQQQQQSNSVIQYPATVATTASTSAVKARYKTMYACEDRQLSMDCETGSKINLIRANFGRFSITQCNEQGQLDLQTDCMSPITFRIMQEKCQDKQKCSVNATSLIFGDKCPKTRKYLEVHFQCQTIEPDMVDVRKPLTSMLMTPSLSQAQSPLVGMASSNLKPPNNPTSTPRSNPFSSPVSNNYQDEQAAAGFSQSSSSSSSEMVMQNNQQHQVQQLPTPVINSPLMSSSNAINALDATTNKLSLSPFDQDNIRDHQPIIISMRHLQIENMSRPRCYQWDGMSNQWTERGTRILETNQTHTICAFDQSTSYVLVMDYSGPMQTISPSTTNNGNNNNNNSNSNKQNTILSQPSANPIFNSPPPPDFLDSQPVPIDSYGITAQSAFSPNQFDVNNKMVYPPQTSTQQQQHQQQQNQQQQQQSSGTRMFSLFGYLLAIILVLMGLVTLALVASNMRSSAGAALKSLGNFAPFNGPKYNKRRQQGQAGPAGLSPNKDLLVINNANGHQFIYAPASSTKISSSPSTHILSAGQPTGLVGQHQGSLHRVQHQQQQQMYSGNGATLSSLSGTGAQSNNYYYGLMGLNPLFQQQQQQQQQQHQQSHNFSQHHLNQQQQQQQQPPQAQIATNYSHQANKSTASAESANSSSSSSGVESSSTSMQLQQQQQQTRTQQACIVSTSGNLHQADFNLMSHHISSNYGQHQHHHHPQHHQHQQAGAMTLNAHYSTSGGGLQSMANMSPVVHSRQASSQLRDHIYECVDDDKPYTTRLLMPTNNELHRQQQQQQQQFSTLGHRQFNHQANGDCRTLSLALSHLAGWS